MVRGSEKVERSSSTARIDKKNFGRIGLKSEQALIGLQERLRPLPINAHTLHFSTIDKDKTSLHIVQPY